MFAQCSLLTRQMLDNRLANSLRICIYIYIYTLTSIIQQVSLTAQYRNRFSQSTQNTYTHLFTRCFMLYLLYIYPSLDTLCLSLWSGTCLSLSRMYRSIPFEATLQFSRRSVAPPRGTYMHTPAKVCQLFSPHLLLSLSLPHSRGCSINQHRHHPPPVRSMLYIVER